MAYRVGLSNKMDLTTHVGLERASEFVSLVKPRWIWVSPPCGPTSTIQNLNQRTDEQIRNLQQKVKKSRKLARGCVRLVENRYPEAVTTDGSGRIPIRAGSSKKFENC